MRTRQGWIALVIVGSASLAQAAGYEKAIMLSGRWAGVGNAAAGAVEDAEALYFNPAGLGGGRLLDVSLNFSPTVARFSGPVGLSATDPTGLRTSTLSFSPIFGVFAKYNPLPNLGFGLGLYVPGGTNVTYERVSFSGFNPQFDALEPELKVDLSVTELAAGVGYEVFKGLRVGAAYRISMVRAELGSASPLPPAGPGQPPPALLAVSLRDLSDFDFGGFRVGAQYQPEDLPFGLGVSWRSPVKFTAEGEASGRIETAQPGAPAADLPGGDTTVSSDFPSQISAGGYVSLLDKTLRLFGQYDFTHYEVDRSLAITGTVTTPAGPAPIPSIVQDWRNQHNVRAGVEYLVPALMAIRGGYVFTSQVTPNERARATFASPGVGTTFVLGFGTLPTARGLRLDVAFEYSFASGDGTNELGRTGKFSSDAFAAHLGLGWAG
jgi:long-subunit fatty acid transport protein